MTRVPLGHEKDTAGRAIVDILGDLSRQIGPDAGDQRGRYDRARMKDSCTSSSDGRVVSTAGAKRPMPGGQLVCI
jgi:hypothetical protein